jgi:ferrous iron transport protein A
VSELIPLQILPCGHTALVEHVAGDEAVVHRVREMGFRDGAAVEMVQPGDSCIVRIGGQKLAFRLDASVSIFVREAKPVGIDG